jgi:hypothetical protein
MTYIVEFANCNPGAFVMLSGFVILAACAAFHEITFTDSMFDAEMDEIESHRDMTHRDVLMQYENEMRTK